MRNFLLFFTFLFSLADASAQVQEGYPCGTIGFPEEGNFDYKNRFTQKDRQNVVYTIPVVFHVIHQGGPENVTRTKIEEALEQLNRDFDKRNADLLNSPAAFRNLAVDVDIEFRLARKDPSGSCTDGVNRIYSKLTNNYNFDRNLNKLIHWNPEMYLNIYILNKIYITNLGNLGGWGTYPSRPTHADTDGIYLVYNGLASSLISHEVGHWLGLGHIWGSSVKESEHSCSDDDLIEDTPVQYGPSFACNEDYPLLTCGNSNMFSNFMDYGSCRTMFTEGQKTRMINALHNTQTVRYNIWQPDNLTATGVDIVNNTPCNAAPIAEFNTNQNDIVLCESPATQVQFEAVAYRGQATTFEWFFEGGAPAHSTNAKEKVSYAAEGNYQVTLIAKNEYGSDTITRKVVVHVVPQQPAYSSHRLVEDFESVNDADEAGIVYKNNFGGFNWELAFNVGYSGRKSLKLKTGLFKETYRFTTDKFSTINQSNNIFSFKLSYPQTITNSISQDKLYILPSIGCLESTPYFGGYQVDTSLFFTYSSNEHDFTPSMHTHWKEINIQIPAQFLGREDVQFTFTLDTDGKNPKEIFIDDIEVKRANKLIENLGKWKIIPNPARNVFNLILDENIAKATLQIYDVQGIKILEQLVYHTTPVEISGLSSGLYFCRLIDWENQVDFEVKKISIIK
ncbi:MAG: M43 family zinc metalloprotease [Saprospiraceae bacterium]